MFLRVACLLNKHRNKKEVLPVTLYWRKMPQIMIKIAQYRIYKKNKINENTHPFDNGAEIIQYT